MGRSWLTLLKLPFEKLLEELQPERDLSRTPLFQVFFNMLNLPGDRMELPGLTVESPPSLEVGSRFDLTLYVSEHDGEVRRRVLEGMGWAGVELDVDMNEKASGLARIDTGAGKTQVWVVPTDEELGIAEEVKMILQA